MKKLSGAIFSILAFVLMTAALTLPVLGTMIAVNAGGKVSWLAPVFGGNALIGLGVTAGVCAFVILIGSIINGRCRKASYVLSIVFGLGVYAAMMYLSNWGPFVPQTPILAALKLTTVTNANLLYIGAGAMALGLILSAIGRMLYRNGKKAKEEAVTAKKMQPHETYVPTSRDTDLAMASSRTPKIERYVRDPWGNLIKEEDYNERVNGSKNNRY